MSTVYTRGFRAEGDQSESGPIRFVAATEDVGRDGLIIDSAGWELANYELNPVVLWVHSYFGDHLPIGTAAVEVKDKKLYADITFDSENDDFARQVEGKYRRNVLSAISVGWNTLEMEPTENPKVYGKVTRAELLDISAVPVPGDPNALKERAVRGLIDMAGLTDFLTRDVRGPLPANTDAPKADEAAEWDTGQELGKAPAATEPLRRMHAWVDAEGDADAKSSYKLPHHRADGELVWRGVAAAMSRLMQGGTDIPDDDRRGVYNHLAAHYRQFEKDPPEFRSVSASDAEVIWPGTALMMARLYLDMTDDADDDERLRRYRVLERRYRALGKEPPEWMARPQLCLLDDETIRGLFGSGEGALLGWEADSQRAGAMLSARNRGDLEHAVNLVRGVLERAAKEEAEADERAFLNTLMPTIDQTGDLLARLAG